MCGKLRIVQDSIFLDSMPKQISLQANMLTIGLHLIFHFTLGPTPTKGSFPYEKSGWASQSH